MIGDEAGGGGGERDEDQCGNVRQAEARVEWVEEDVRKGYESSDDRGGCRDVGEEQREGRDGGEDGRKRLACVDVE